VLTFFITLTLFSFAAVVVFTMFTLADMTWDANGWG
jgi:hypothetical protein